MKCIAAIMILLLTASTAFAATFPKPSGYVNDFAGILPDSAALDQELRAYESNTTIEIAIVTIAEMPADQTAATYAVELFHEWGIGKKGEDNGILVLIIRNGTTGNRMRIELGYGIQGYITGAEAGRILDAALPYYSAGDYQQAARTILDGLYKQLEKYIPGQPPQRDAIGRLGDYVPLFFFLFFAAMFVLAFYFGGRCPKCRSRKIKCYDTYCVCQKCGHRFKRSRNSSFFLVAGGYGGGFGGGGGGFGGGGSGGGGAGR